MMRTLAKIVIHKLGYEIRTSSDTGYNASTLSRICSPNTVIDVGVGHGTYPLYEAFPGARFLLLEPLEEYAPSLQRIAHKYDCEIYRMAVGDREGRMEMLVDTSALEKSSFRCRTPLTQTGNQLQRRMIEVTTLDAIYRERPPLVRPVLLKIDTEGHELSVLRGAKTLLGVVDAAIIEVSIANRFEGSYEFEDVLHLMNQHGFYLFCVLKMMRRRGELRQSFADVVFKRRSGEDRSTLEGGRRS